MGHVQRRKEGLKFIMARYTGPKDRLSRRENYDLFGKGAKLTRINIPPGVHGPKGTYRGRPSEYLKQLREKQKVKRLYGVLEKQFRGYIDKAEKTKGNTAEKLFQLLETRLDNVVFRLGFANSRPMARQLVTHRHVFVDGKRVNIPSYQVRKGQTVSLSDKALQMPDVKELLKAKEANLPKWLQKKAAAGKILRLPVRDDIPEPVDDQAVIEFYSR